MRQVLGLLAVCVCAIAACGGGASGAGGGGGGAGGEGGAPLCGEHPLECAAGQTCWFTSSGPLRCLPSGAGKEGEACSPVVDAPTCGDGLLCVRETGAEGTCLKLCEPAMTAEVCGDLFCKLVQAPGGGETRVCYK